MWHGAWSWDEFFLPYFAHRGFSCYAPNLRGHGGSAARGHLRSIRIRDYVDDVAEVVAGVSELPVLVGHSMGGFIVQKYLEQHPAAGAILVASIPPTGAAKTALRVLRRHPVAFATANLRLSPASLVATPSLARSLFFSDNVSTDRVTSYQQRLADDSYLAFLDLIVLDLPKRRQDETLPMLVLGAEDDALVSPDQVRRTAAANGAQLAVFPGMGHDMMLEPGWQDVADRMLDWLDTHVA